MTAANNISPRAVWQAVSVDVGRVRDDNMHFYCMHEDANRALTVQIPLEEAHFLLEALAYRLNRTIGER